MAIYNKSLISVTQERLGVVCLDLRGRVFVNIEIDLCDNDGGIVKKNHRTITYDGAEAITFWKNYNSDEYIERIIIGESDGEVDTGYLPDGL